MRTAEEWGRVAVSLPGWRWIPGMVDIGQSLRVVAPQLATCTDRYRGEVCPSESGTADGWCRAWVINYDPDIDDEMCDRVPDPDDPATAGCLLVLAGAPHRLLPTVEAWLSGAHVEGMTLGRACIADVRDQWGRWPGGEE